MAKLLIGIGIFTWFACASVSPAISEYLTNRQDWSNLNETQKFAYVMGIFDGSFGTDFEGPGADAARCTREMGLTSSSLVDLIDNGY